MVEGLSLILHKEKWLGLITGLKFSSMLSITHILFVDDVMLFGSGKVQECKFYTEIIKLFCVSSGMEVSFSMSNSYLTRL